MSAAHLAALVAEHGAGNVALVANMSGGKDSCLMLARLVEQYPELRLYVVHADTGFEHVRPISAADFARQVTAALGHELAVCRNPNKTYLQMVERRGKFPATGQRQCTSDLKRGPIETWIRRNVRERVIVSCIGIRADESHARAKATPWKRNERLSVAGRLVFDWLPIFEVTTAEVYAELDARGIPLHPVYRRAGGYLDRLSCRVCIFFTPRDLAATQQHDPEAFELVAALEERLGFTMKHEGTVRELAARHLPVLDSSPDEAPCYA